MRESDPFAPEETFGPLPMASSPIVGRRQAMWESMRPKVLEVLPATPSVPRDTIAYLQFVSQASEFLNTVAVSFSALTSVSDCCYTSANLLDRWGVNVRKGYAIAIARPNGYRHTTLTIR